MKIGFYAPLKSPHHPNPSGDREIGRLFLKALRALGHDVEMISQLRSWEGYGSIEAQKQIQLAAEDEIRSLLSRYANSPGPDLIFTYHVYHKAPDWIGCELAAALDIPYVIAEASLAPKQLNGPWDLGHRQTVRCLQQADRIISINPTDIDCIQPLVKDRNAIRLLKPFLDRSPKMLASNRSSPDDHGKVKLITVAMMRDGDKKASYLLMSRALKRLQQKNWRLTVIGDGDAASEVKSYFAELSAECVFAGQCDHEAIYRELTNSDIFVWPAVNEALGLALLEAQAFGLPVVAQNHGGVSAIVEHDITGLVTPAGDMDQYVQALDSLISNTDRRREMGAAAKSKFCAEHSFDNALQRIESILGDVCLP